MMKNVIKCLFFLLLCANFAFGQLLEERKRINIYDNHPGFKYYWDIVKKEKKKSLSQMSYESPFFIETGKSISLSENELLAVNMVVDKHKKNSRPSPMQSSIYIYKIDQKILYVEITQYKRTTNRPSPRGGGSTFLIDLEKMSIIDEWMNQK